MIRPFLVATGLTLAIGWLSVAQAQPGDRKERVVGVAADAVVNRISSSSCDDFAAGLEEAKARKAKGGSEQRERLTNAMQRNPELRAEFINKVAGPLANKLFDCGLIP